ncbi:hypothetical protein U2F10_24025 [Leptothoe sp. EHU-05/26/07-4]
MSDPVTLTVGAIAALAFTKFLESSAGEAAKKLTPTVLDKTESLRQKIWTKLRGIPAVDELNAAVEKNGQVNESQVKLLTPHLEAAMKADDSFSQDIRQLASEISQDINIGEILGENVQNIYGGSAIMINNPKAPTVAGNNSHCTFNIITNN